MSTVAEIVAAAKQLDAGQLLELRKQLEEIEERQWDDELVASTEELRQKGISDEDLDQMVLRRRYEGRR